MILNELFKNNKVNLEKEENTKLFYNESGSTPQESVYLSFPLRFTKYWVRSFC